MGGSNSYLRQIDGELRRVRQGMAFRKSVADTVRTLILIAAVAVLIAVVWLPVFVITGDGMEPALSKNALVAAIKSSRGNRGDVIAFYHGNKILVKRVIALGGDTVDIAEDGTVTVNGEAERYTLETALGECDITLPYTVPDGTLFVLGDNRESSVDSRSTAVGTVSPEQIAGKVFVILWPGISLVK